jgi:hypothetical protein
MKAYRRHTDTFVAHVRAPQTSAAAPPPAPTGNHQHGRCVRPVHRRRHARGWALGERRAGAPGGCSAAVCRQLRGVARGLIRRGGGHWRSYVWAILGYGPPLPSPFFEGAYRSISPSKLADCLVDAGIRKLVQPFYYWCFQPRRIEKYHNHSWAMSMPCWHWTPYDS